MTETGKIETRPRVQPAPELVPALRLTRPGVSELRRWQAGHPRMVPLIARCTATLVGDELVLTMRNGAEHSRIPVDDTMDPVEAMERMHQGTMPVLLLWSYEELDEALARDGWSRVGEWRYGPSADVQRID